LFQKLAANFRFPAEGDLFSVSLSFAAHSIPCGFCMEYATPSIYRTELKYSAAFNRS